MNKTHKALFAVFSIICVILCVLLLLKSRGYDKSTPSYSGGTQRISEVTATVNGQTEKVTLPYTFKNLAPRTPVTLTASFSSFENDCIYVKSVYAPLKVYANGELIYSCGQDGSYPSFLKDPATTVAFIPTGGLQGEVELRMEYLSPVGRSSLTVQPPLQGKMAAVLQKLIGSMGFSFVFALIQICCGLLLAFIALFVLPVESKTAAFLWLGLFSAITGLWTLGECNLTGLIVRNPTVLYLMAFTGLFLLPVPLLLFGQTVVNFHHKTPMLTVTYLCLAAAATAFVLQLSGVVPFYRSMYVFHILVPVSLLIFAACIFYEGLRYKNKAARRFFLPIATLAFFAVLEVLNYQLRLTNVLSLLFQIGVMLSIVFMGFSGGLFVRDGIRLKSETQRLEFEVELMEHSASQQKKRLQLLLENQDALRQQRHDLRHQLAVIRSLSEEAGSEKLSAYLDELTAKLPPERAESFCENEVVNAIVSYYAGLAKKGGIEFSSALTVPEHSESISDSSLCVIFGNLLENAVEACNRMTDGEKFIRLKSRFSAGTLTIVMDNSFSGAVSEKGGRLLSVKRPEYGTGTASITSVAESHGGGAKFEADGKVFLSSVYVRA